MKPLLSAPLANCRSWDCPWLGWVANGVGGEGVPFEFRTSRQQPKFFYFTSFSWTPLIKHFFYIILCFLFVCFTILGFNPKLIVYFFILKENLSEELKFFKNQLFLASIFLWLKQVLFLSLRYLLCLVTMTVLLLLLLLLLLSRFSRV